MSVKRMKLRLKIHPAGAVLAALGLMLFPSAGMLALGLAGVFQGRVNLSLFLLPPYLAYAAWQSSMGGSLRGAAAALEGEPWPKGKLLRALPFVCRGTPEKLELLRLLRALPEGRTALLYKFDGQTGRLTEVLAAPKIAESLTRQDKE